MHDLRFGIHAGQQHASFDDYLEIWRFAEAAGLDWASVFDHFLPIQSDPTGPCFEGMTLLAAMAAHTERLRCGVIVTGVTYRNPAVLANMAVTIDHVSGGRMELGLGGAWYEDEHRQYGIPFPRGGERLDMLDEACQVVKALWTQTEADFAGKHFTLDAARCEPKPLQDPMPLWIGGSGEKKTLRTVAQWATGWNTFFGDPGHYEHLVDVLEEHCAQVGRDPMEIRRQIVVRTVLGETEADARERAEERGVPLDGMVIGTPEQLVERLLPYRELGVGDFLMQGRPPLDRTTVELYAAQVGPALRQA